MDEMIITTTRCRQFGHAEFVLEADTSHVPEIYLRGVVNTVEGMVGQGSVFRPDQTFQVGWMLTQIQSHKSGLLTLFEPDMLTFPIKWVPGITETLRQMILQLFMLDSVGLRGEMSIPTILQSLIVCSRYTEPDFFMSRSDGTHNRDSGWFVGCLKEKHDHNDPANLNSLSLYDAFLHQPGIQGFMSFPAGSMIVMDQNEGMSIMKDGNKLPVEPGSFLSAWFERQRTI